MIAGLAASKYDIGVSTTPTPTRALAALSHDEPRTAARPAISADRLDDDIPKEGFNRRGVLVPRTDARKRT
jgi:hypothetical protein